MDLLSSPSLGVCSACSLSSSVPFSLSVTLFFFFFFLHLLPTILSCTVSRGPGEPPGGQREMERSGGPHSDSGSISPTWERDRRGPPPGPLPGPPGPLGPPGVCSYVRERKKLERTRLLQVPTQPTSHRLSRQCLANRNEGPKFQKMRSV